MKTEDSSPTNDSNQREIDMKEQTYDSPEAEFTLQSWIHGKAAGLAQLGVLGIECVSDLDPNLTVIWGEGSAYGVYADARNAVFDAEMIDVVESVHHEGSDLWAESFYGPTPFELLLALKAAKRVHDGDGDVALDPLWHGD